jgi:hypothetical protein
LPTASSSSTTKSNNIALGHRIATTLEVTVSKIFPAGFGWQSASVFADAMGKEADSLDFALLTGLGDAVGVFAGHSLYYLAKKHVVDSSINMAAEVQTGFLLGSAAFCSGTAWQPIVNTLQGANLPFWGVFWGTWAGCGAAFYGGLRAGRTIYSGFCSHIPAPTYDNSKTDAALSAVIGGATGFFVGTDAAYLPEQNFLIDIVGIQDGTSDLTGAVIAGASTSLGFATSNTFTSMIYPAGQAWNDP